MLFIKQLSFRNFRSYGKNLTVVDFTAPGTTIITAVNPSGGTTNGAGKTSILHCLTWLFYDQVIDTVSKEELINNINKVDLWGEVLFNIESTECVVQRWRNGGKNFKENGVRLLVNGQDQTLSTVALTNAKIEEMIGIDFDLFTRIVVYSASNKSFFELPSTSTNGASQTDMIEQLFNLQVLSEKAKQLKTHIKATEEEIRIQERLIQQVQTQLQSHDRLVASGKKRITDWDVDKTQRLSELMSRADLISTLDFDREIALHEKLQTLTANKTAVFNEARQSDTTQVSLVNKLTALQNEVTKLQSSVCPYCEQPFVTSAEKIAHLQTKIATQTSQLEALREIGTTLTDELQTIVTELAETKREIRVSDYRQLMSLRDQHTTIAATIDELQRQTNPHIATVQQLLDNAPQSPSFDTINSISNLNEHQQLLLKLLTKKDSFIRKALLQKNIPLLNDRLQHHLVELGLPHTVIFSPNLTASMSQFGRELSYGCLSAGQKARINLALFFAFSDISELLHNRINIRMCDEVLDVGLCNQGIKAASHLLKRKAAAENISIFVISHREEIQSFFDNTIVIEVKDGFSQLTQETQNGR